MSRERILWTWVVRNERQSVFQHYNRLLRQRHFGASTTITSPYRAAVCINIRTMTEFNR